MGRPPIPTRQFPCRDCTERHIGCHATCEKYNDARTQKDAAKAATEAAKTGAAQYWGYRADQKTKAMRRELGGKARKWK